MKIISEKQFKMNQEKLFTEYVNNVSDICSKYNIDKKTYNLIADIIKNEIFKENIDTLAKGDAELNKDIQDEQVEY